MSEVVLQKGEVRAVISPDKGMNLCKLQVKGVDFIDLKTIPLFEERLAGLGSLIGPHFHHRPSSEVVKVPKESAFPHIAKVKAKGVKEPFSHGIARYVPWTYQSTETTCKATLSGDDEYQGMTLSSLEGFLFHMQMNMELIENGIQIDLSIDSQNPSLVGLHYYYTLPPGGGKVLAEVEKEYRTSKGLKAIPKEFLDRSGNLCIDAKTEADFGFFPKKTGRGYEIFYENETYFLKITFDTGGAEASWQLYHPKGESYICLEPLSAKNPKKPSYHRSYLRVKIEALGIKT